MQIKFFCVPAFGDAQLEDTLNAFLRSKKILEIQSHFSQAQSGGIWNFCIRYLEHDSSKAKENLKVDYKQVLDEPTFSRFVKYRDIRKALAQQEAIPPYVIFTDAELAAMAKITPLTFGELGNISGIGARKTEKYGQYFVESPNEQHDEAGR